MTPDTRRLMSQALAKALAFKQCGNDQQADAWAGTLVTMLADAGITPKEQSTDANPTSPVHAGRD